MTAGALWLVVMTLALFIVASGVSWWFGLLDDAISEPIALAALAVVMFILWALPTALAWAAWLIYR